ncbi:hypothetical protein CXB51_035024 [Gossypium anomalum]|uniref:O-fucosyltransferase family protein n=1 Tax=Gossypium anomalum TaxID=47600 RepID=A0A8J5XQJ2_9ROSI|nr:hypothetical protein CXB51_035024 [Gossypium anomalum]
MCFSDMPLLEATENWFCPGPKSVKPGGGSSPNFTWLRLVTEMEDWKPALVEWSSVGDIRAEKLKNWVNKATNMDKIKRLVVSKSPGCDRFRLWMVGITTTMLLQWVLSSQSGDNIGTITAKVEAPPYFPPPRDYKNQGYLMVSCNGGLNKMIADVSLFLAICVHIIMVICDIVAIARLLNLTLVVPVLDKTSFWHDSRSTDGLYSMFPASLLLQHGELSHTAVIIPEILTGSGNVNVFPRFQKYEVVRFAKTDSRLGNNVAVEVQKMRCRVNSEALRGREKGPFLVLHVRYEMDMLAFSGCTQGCNQSEVEELTRLRSKQLPRRKYITIS